MEKYGKHFLGLHIERGLNAERSERERGVNAERYVPDRESPMFIRTQQNAARTQRVCKP